MRYPGEFLRETLAFGGEDRITVARELALLERFLAIERVRFGDRCAPSCAPEAGGCFVPPLLLQPLVENAVTHGIAHLIEGDDSGERGTQRRLVAHHRRESLRSRSAQARRRRVGLANVRARLRAMHGGDAALLAGERNDTWRVEVTLPAATGEA